MASINLSSSIETVLSSFDCKLSFLVEETGTVVTEDDSVDVIMSSDVAGSCLRVVIATVEYTFPVV